MKKLLVLALVGSSLYGMQGQVIKSTLYNLIEYKQVVDKAGHCLLAISCNRHNPDEPTYGAYFEIFDGHYWRQEPWDVGKYAQNFATGARFKFEEMAKRYEQQEAKKLAEEDDGKKEAAIQSKLHED